MSIEEIFDNPHTISSWLIAEVAKKLDLKINEIDVREDLINYGLNSMEAISISAELEKMLGIQLSPTLVWDYPNIEQLSQQLFEEIKAKKLKNLLSNFEKISETEKANLLSSLISEIDSLADSSLKN